MLFVVKNAWALLVGMLLLMMGNGLQGTLLAVRGNIEGFNASTMSVIMTGYFVGFLIGSRLAPLMIRRVGHVRVFAALASFTSAVFILYPALPDPVIWTILRIMVGLCFSGVYVVAESWLNDVSTNETRGQALSAYLIVQMLGIISAQAVINLADPSGYQLFVIMSVLVSISFGPILLSVNPVPAFQSTKGMSLRELFKVSPLGCVGTFLLGGIFSAQFAMGSVYATQVGMSLSHISLFVAMIYIGGMLLQYPLGYLSDKMDRRILIAAITGFGGVFVLIGTLFSSVYAVILAMAFVMGGVANPLYSVLIAYTNDYLDHDDMAAGSGGLIFLNGVGALFGPIVVGSAMTNFGPNSFFVFIGFLFLSITGYAAYRMTQRATGSVEDSGSVAPILPQATAVMVEAAQEYAIEQDSTDDVAEVTH